MAKRIYVGRSAERYGINLQSTGGLGERGSSFYDTEEQLFEAIREYDNRAFYIQLDKRLSEESQKDLLEAIKAQGFRKLIDIRINGKSVWKQKPSRN